MRDLENFKAYVHEKAEITRENERKRRTHRLRFVSMAASVCIVFGVLIFALPIIRGADKFSVQPANEVDMFFAKNDLLSEEIYLDQDAQLSEMETAEDFSYGFCTETTVPVMLTGETAAFPTSPTEDDGSDGLGPSRVHETTAEPGSGGEALQSFTGTFCIRETFDAMPSVDHYTVAYTEEAVTVTLYLDRLPSASGSVLFEYTVELDTALYSGQPVQVVYNTVLP